MSQFLVPGHCLVAEGAAFISVKMWEGDTGEAWSYQRVQPNGVGGSGLGLCSCGAESPILSAGRERKAWHRKHKADIYYSWDTSRTPWDVNVIVDEEEGVS